MVLNITQLLTFLFNKLLIIQLHLINVNNILSGNMQACRTNFFPVSQLDLHFAVMSDDHMYFSQGEWMEGSEKNASFSENNEQIQ